MKKIFTYLTIGLIAISSLFISGAMADVESPLIRPLTTDAKLVSSDYAVSSMPVEVEEAVIYPDGISSKLLIKPGYSSLKLQPGESREFTVSVTSREDETITIDPKLVMQPYTENYLEDDWVEISPESVELIPDAEQEFTVEVSIPEDADIGYYNAFIVFGEYNEEEYSTYSGYDGSMELSIEVWIPPSIQVLTNYINDRVEAGNSYDYEIKLSNVGEEDIAMDPQVVLSDIYYAEESIAYRFDEESSGQVIDISAITLDAPSVIRAGETVTVNVHLEVPEATIGSFSASVDLGIDDPALSDWEEQVQLYFTVWQQPEEPFVREFTTSSNGTIRIEVSSTQYTYYPASGNSVSGHEAPSFEVTLNKAEEKVNLRLVSSTSKGNVNYGTTGTVRPLMPADNYDYQTGVSTYTEVYEVSGEAGEWSLSILPENTESFEYSITVLS